MLATQLGYEKGAWLENLKEIIYGNYSLFKNELNKNIPEIVISDLQGTYLVLLDLRKILASDKTKDFIQDKCSLAVDYGEWFGENLRAL